MPDDVFEFDAVVEKRMNDFLTLLVVALISLVLASIYYLNNDISLYLEQEQSSVFNLINLFIQTIKLLVVGFVTWQCWQCLQLQKIYLTTQDTAYIIPLWVYKKNMALYLFAYTLLHFVVNILYFFIFQVFFKNI